MDNNKRPESMERITTLAQAAAFIDEQVAAVRAQVGDSHDQRSSGVIDFLRQEDNTVIQQTGKNIIAALTAAGLLNNIRY